MFFSILGHFMRICRYRETAIENGSGEVDLCAEIHTRLASR